MNKKIRGGITAIEEAFADDKFTSWEYATKILSEHIENTKLYLIYKEDEVNLP